MLSTKREANAARQRGCAQGRNHRRSNSATKLQPSVALACMAIVPPGRHSHTPRSSAFVAGHRPNGEVSTAAPWRHLKVDRAAGSLVAHEVR